MKSFAWFLFTFIDAVCRLVIHLTWPIFRWLYNGAQRGVPPVYNSDLLMKSGIELSAMIRRRQV